MTARRISTNTPNQTVAQLATVTACGRDYGTASDRTARAEEAIGQNEAAKFRAKASAEAPGRRR